MADLAIHALANINLNILFTTISTKLCHSPALAAINRHSFACGE